MQLKDLLDRAKQHTGSDSETGRRLDPPVTGQRVNDWRAGRRPCPLTVQAQICLLCGMTDAEAANHVWEVVRSRLGKKAGEILGVAALIGSIGVGVARLAALSGDGNGDGFIDLNRAYV